MPNLDTSETLVLPATETRSQSQSAEDDALSQAMLTVLERVSRPHSRSRGRELITKQLRTNRAKLFRGVTGVAPTMAKYWLEATKRIMNNIDCTSEQKVKGAVYLLHGEAYRWWLSVEEVTQPDRLNWDYFKTAFKGKYVGASYIDTRKREFMNLTQCDKSVAEYEAEFLRLNRYT
ncbi:uncharacterized protein [Gossypium hirsutum]|uniref:Retrotransposon gag domain-containing protein n=1 Tax=Gossypium hirsutum TaxID=3635 RepID=A0A1U8KC15_GOSHI|nr:uncharacterized protein LOC107915387 [Gossypium hirsutum]